MQDMLWKLLVEGLGWRIETRHALMGCINCNTCQQLLLATHVQPYTQRHTLLIVQHTPTLIYFNSAHNSHTSPLTTITHATTTTTLIHQPLSNPLTTTTLLTTITTTLLTGHHLPTLPPPPPSLPPRRYPTAPCVSWGGCLRRTGCTSPAGTTAPPPTVTACMRCTGSWRSTGQPLQTLTPSSRHVQGGREGGGWSKGRHFYCRWCWRRRSVPLWWCIGCLGNSSVLGCKWMCCYFSSWLWFSLQRS